MEQGRKDEGRRTGGDKDDDAGREGRPGGRQGGSNIEGTRATCSLECIFVYGMFDENRQNFGFTQPLMEKHPILAFLCKRLGESFISFNLLREFQSSFHQSAENLHFIILFCRLFGEEPVLLSRNSLLLNLHIAVPFG